MTKILVIGDPHFMHNNKESTDIMHKSIMSKVNEMEPDFIVVLGDFFDRHSEINIGANERGSNFIFDLMKKCHVYMLVGNHDMLNNSQFFPKEHSLCAFKKYDNITVVRKTKKITIDGNDIVFVPYVPPGRFREALDYVDDWENATIIFAHQEFKGAMMTARKASLTGDSWPEEYPWVVSGHIHTRHKIRSNIYYPGSPQQVKINDDEDRYIAKVELSDKVRISKIKIKSLVKREVTLTVDQIKKYIPEDGVKLKVNIIGTQEEQSKLANKSDIISKWKAKGVKVVTEIKITKKNINLEKIGRPYREIVFDRIGDNIGVREMYENIIKNVK